MFNNNRKGFTLVELMIVVAIIGILAAIAIPNFVSMQYRAKRAEVPSNVDGIKTAQIAYDADRDTYLEIGTALPTGTPDKQLKDWPQPAAGFDDIGWRPDGRVRGQYVAFASAVAFNVGGASDVDGDSTLAVYEADQQTNAVLSTGTALPTAVGGITAETGSTSRY